MTNDADAQPVVVVGLDGSEESAAALRWAVRYAAAAGASVRAVLAWHFPTSASVPPAGIAPPPLRSEVEGRIAAALEEATAKAAPDASGVHIDGQIRYGHPAQVLIEESRSADLLVVGRRGHGAFIGMLVGSVSQHCVAAAECPVVVVRDHGPADPGRLHRRSG
jgi:nucleotide-binding universal stress UspA family protein